MQILEPVKFRNLELRNRLVWLPAVTCMADEIGFVTDELIERHVARERAASDLSTSKPAASSIERARTFSASATTNSSPD